MTQEFINKVIRESMVDTKQYRYVAFEQNDLDHQYQVIMRMPITSLETTDAIDGWEVFWDNRDSLKTYPDGWYTVRGQDVYVEDGIVVRGMKKDSNGSNVTAYTYISDGHSGFDRTTVSIIEFIGGKGTLL